MPKSWESEYGQPFFHSNFDFVNYGHCFLREDGTVYAGEKRQKAV